MSFAQANPLLPAKPPGGVSVHGEASPLKQQGGEEIKGERAEGQLGTWTGEGD